MNIIFKTYICKKDKIKGFTLIELIIVIAILGILSAIVIPKYISYANSSSETACLSNRRIANSTYLMYLANGGLIIKDNYSGTSFLVNSGDLYDEVSCPSDGTFSWIVDSDGNAYISCSVHNPSKELGDIVLETMFNLFDLLKGKTDTEKATILGINNNNFSNDTYRAYILKNDFNGTWPTLSVDLPKKYEITINGSELKIMPFSNSKDLSDPVIYASTNTGNSWNSPVFYYPGKGWYIHKNSYNVYTGVTFSSYTGTDIKNLIDSKPSEWESLK
ncbi:prepilin-type N-terminal cleavage/methylation domain-containing protein [Clostridium grantii]|uniref:Prepilin-type N-terminal cleavage/methylation domain-containing protein n=1 Tax=Clostridium grantii DSM 8605 TaxID=1121316 RepID=A0A1M5QZK0_9CLOT|nr:prepilin-type N-terminal cleavage/methylation domain-containing protein [Clostridium grantii]SHH18963.1 prepilin-type N-terminal cleavage/methylation domain-containing protein [Clostridium grantii DSM 8605]